jgi:DNA-binding transcriptional LysR family regulator
MDFRQLRHFLSVAEELHFGRAAERLGMTQPPLSQSIQALEHELGVQLFFRTKRSVTLTSVGSQWLPYVQRLLRDAENLPHIASRLSRGEIGRLRLAFVSTASYSMLPKLVSRYKQQYPEVEITLTEATSDVQVEGLLSGVFDAGLLIAPPDAAVPNQLAYAPLHQEELVAAVPERWIKVGRLKPHRQRLRHRDIQNEPLLLFPRRSAPKLYDLITGYFARHHAEPRVDQEAVQMQTIISLVSEGIGIALVPESMRNLARVGVTYCSLVDGPMTMETGLAWHKNNQSPALQHLITLANTSS